MEWNSHFDWNCEPFHFVELFAGAAHTSRAWIQPQNLHHLELLTSANRHAFSYLRSIS